MCRAKRGDKGWSLESESASHSPQQIHIYSLTSSLASVQHHEEDPCVPQALVQRPEPPPPAGPRLRGDLWTSWEAGAEGDFLAGGSPSLQAPSLKGHLQTEAELCPSQGPSRHLEFVRRLCRAAGAHQIFIGCISSGELVY